MLKTLRRRKDRPTSTERFDWELRGGVSDMLNAQRIEGELQLQAGKLYQAIRDAQGSGDSDLPPTPSVGYAVRIVGTRRAD